MLKEDNKLLSELSPDKYALAIKKNNNCLKEFFKQSAA